MTRRGLLFTVILLEGYVTLAAELLAIRLLIPYVGSATDTIAVIISAVLLPLAAGYHYGGRREVGRRARHVPRKRQGHVRGILLSNATQALILLLPGLSFPVLEMFFAALEGLGVQGRVPLAALYCLVFLVYPVFLLGQTVPLISRYFARETAAETTGIMLFFSTLGSFLGSIFSTLALMSWLGVHATAIVTLGMLCLLIALLARRKFDFEHAFALCCFAMAVALNGKASMEAFRIVADTPYSTVTVTETPDGAERVMSINRSLSSKWSQDRARDFPYVRFIERSVLEGLRRGDAPCGRECRVLIVGAGGFVMGMDDPVSRYTYVDIDGALKEIAETHLLKRPLRENARFVPEPAEYFLRRDRTLYDVIVLDAFSNTRTIPPSLITREFFLLARERLKPGGVLALNAIVRPDFGDAFSLRLDNTFRSVFPHYTRQIVRDFDYWSAGKKREGNVIYLYRRAPSDKAIYTHDRNTYFLDR